MTNLPNCPFCFSKAKEIKYHCILMNTKVFRFGCSKNCNIEATSFASKNREAALELYTSWAKRVKSLTAKPLPD